MIFFTANGDDAIRFGDGFPETRDARRSLHTAIDAGETVFWHRDGEVRLVPAAVIENALAAFLVRQDMLSVGLREGVVRPEVGVIRWGQCLPMEPVSRPPVTVQTGPAGCPPDPR